MIYTVVLTFALMTGRVVEFKRTCPDLPCVAVMMVGAHESPSLARFRVFRGTPKMLPGGGSVFPPFVDHHLQ